MALEVGDRRARRHEETKAEILAAAWGLARERGLAGLSLAELGSRVGMRAPSLYSYFASKNAIYDAMFAEGNRQLLEFIRERLALLPAQPRQRLRGGFRITFDFATADPVRYQLLFERTIPGFEPSAESYAVAVEVLRVFREDLAVSGLFIDPTDEDLLSAVGIGLVTQQIANDPGGDRWAGLVEEAADMAYDHLMRKRRRKR